MIMSPRSLIAAVVVVASTTIAPIAHADGKNEIRAVTFDEAVGPGVTSVHVRGADAPTFTVYKLDRPTRVVIDMPGSRLSDVMRGHESSALFTPNTWAVSTIAAQQLDDNAVRVIVTMARPGRYDVKSVGNEVVVIVTARDAAPKNASPEELARAQQQASAAETARARAQQQADAANATAKQSRAEADAAKADAERLRKTATDQAAKADAAQRAVAQASQASAADLDKAKKLAAQAKSDADAAKNAAAIAQAEAERTRKAADATKQAALTEAASAKSDAAKARDEATTAKAEADRAEQALAHAKAEAAAAKTDAARTKSAADKKAAEAELALAQAKTDATAQRAALAQATTDAATQRTALAAANTDAATQRTAAEQARKDADAAKRDASRTQAEIAAAKAEAAHNASEANAAKSDLTAAQREAAQRASEVTAAKSEAANAKSEAANAKAEAQRARNEAMSAKADAEAARVAAAADKKKADAERGDAEKVLKDAKQQLASLDKKSASAQELEDKARATNAAAQTREEAARATETSAKQERVAAEAAAKQAREAQAVVAASQRSKAVADAKLADERLATARRATDDAETQRLGAERAAKQAKQELEQSKSALATVEQQRSSAVAAATDAARKRSDAEAAASDATRRRSEAEIAASDAAKQKKAAELAASDAMQKKSQAERDRAEAEAQRIAALDATKSAQAARDAAEKQRKVAERAADTAVAAKQQAETGLADLTTKRTAAERAASELETRSKAEAKAQADMVAAEARKANDQELATAKAAIAKLASDRKQAESDLADRRKAVALQQAEASRLEGAATQAHDAANREETRRAELAQKRGAEEAELAKLAAAKDEAKRVKAQVRVAEADKPVAKSAPVVAKPAPVAAKPEPVATKIAKVSAIGFKGDEGRGQVDITVDSDAKVELGEVTATHVELIVDNAELAKKLERTLDVSKFGSPVHAVSSFRDRRAPNRVRLVAELSQPSTPTIDRDGSNVHWRFSSTEQARAPMKTTNVPSPIVGGFGAASTPVTQQAVTQVPPTNRRRIYHGATVDLDFKDAPLHDLLRALSDTGHINIVIPDTIDAKVTVRLKRVPWDEALDQILQSKGLGYRREGTIYRIDSQKVLDAEDAADAARREAALKSEAPSTEIVRLNYASAAELAPMLQSMHSAHGTIEVDPRTNALIINDVAGNRAAIAKLAYSLDTQTPQISIEARIVEARSTFTRDIGIQWGGSAIAGANGGNATGLVWPSNVAVTGANSDQQTIATGVAAPSDFAVNLPAATGSGEGGALGFSLGSIGGNFNINLRLSALEDSGTVRIISAPKITVLNNKTAKISQGVSIPISVVSAAGTSTQFVQADLALTVTPYVSQRDCAIAMHLLVTKNEPDFVNVGARGDPTILTKTASTDMLVNDGETTVLGGIYTRNSGVAYKKIPLLGDIPVLGWLFKNRRENDDRTEILVFITPKITNRAGTSCVAGKAN